MKICPSCQTSYPSAFSVCPADGTPLQELGPWSDGAVILGKYRILSKLGQGGMGTVYKALHVEFEEPRALKVINPALMADELFVKRFKHEAKITRMLQHPNAVRVDDIDEADDGRPFIVMEFIEGDSLKKVIQDVGPLAAPRACSIIKQAASALAAAHNIGMVHRDIKPDNIVLVQTPKGEQVKVLDFGIAKVKEGRIGSEAGGLTLTGTGVVIGTPQYMSPEQAMGKRGDELDGRSDLYSLGVVMYQMLSGDLPFKADTTMAMILAHLQTPPAELRTIHPELKIPGPIAAVVMQLLEKNRDLRPKNAVALIEAIERAEKMPAEEAPMGATRVISPGAGYPMGAAQELRRSLEANRLRGAGGQAGAGRPPDAQPFTDRSPQGPPSGGGAAMKPGDVPLRTPQQTPGPARIPQPQPPPKPIVVAPKPVPQPKSQWGLWVSLAILALGLGGGALYYYLTRPPSTLAPTIQVPNAPVFTIGMRTGATVSVTGKPKPTLSESGALPRGLSFDASTGEIIGSPEPGTEGTYHVTLTANNGVLPDATQDLAIEVKGVAPAVGSSHLGEPRGVIGGVEPSAVLAPLIESVSGLTFKVGTSGSTTMKVAGKPGPTLSESGTLPRGLRFDPSTGEISGTPDRGTAGSYPITLTATNGISPDATRNITLEVKPAPRAAGELKAAHQAITLGDMYFKRGMFDEAINAYQKGLDAEPGNRMLLTKIQNARKAKRILGR